MPIGIIVESAPGETRVAATPSTVAQLIQLGYEVVVERRTGDAHLLTCHSERAEPPTSFELESIERG